MKPSAKKKKHNSGKVNRSLSLLGGTLAGIGGAAYFGNKLITSSIKLIHINSKAERALRSAKDTLLNQTPKVEKIVRRLYKSRLLKDGRAQAQGRNVARHLDQHSLNTLTRRWNNKAWLRYNSLLARKSGIAKVTRQKRRAQIGLGASGLLATSSIAPFAIRGKHQKELRIGK